MTNLRVPPIFPAASSPDGASSSSPPQAANALAPKLVTRKAPPACRTNRRRLIGSRIRSSSKRRVSLSVSSRPIPSIFSPFLLRAPVLPCQTWLLSRGAVPVTLSPLLLVRGSSRAEHVGRSNEGGPKPVSIAAIGDSSELDRPPALVERRLGRPERRLAGLDLQQHGLATVCGYRLDCVARAARDDTRMLQCRIERAVGEVDLRETRRNRNRHTAVVERDRDPVQH